MALALAPVGGSLVDRYGARRVVLPCLAIEAIGTASLAFARTPANALVVLTLIAVGGAALWSAQTTILATLVTPEERQKTFGLSFTLLNLGIGIGGILGGFVVGVIMWGSIVSWTVAAILDSTDDILPEANAGNAGNDEVIVDAVDEFDCDELSAERALSPARASEFEEQCGSSFLDGELTPTATATEVPLPATPTIPPTDSNRFNCNNIRGTNYRSDEERTWFLDHCLTPTP